MKKHKRLLCPLIALTMSLTLLAGCGSRTEDESERSAVSLSGESGTSADTSSARPGNSTFSHSEGIDENGFWDGIRALDYVEMFDYQALRIPSDVHSIPDAVIQSEIDGILSSFPSQVLNRAVVSGDTVNIDYVGSIGGVEFEGGNTMGMGTYVTAGSPDYIDDFLDQIIGHMPGTTVNVEVTFPNDYGQPDLEGKDAVFVTQINYIAGEPELTDEFVMENLSVFTGWTTVDEMMTGLKTDMQRNAIQEYIQEFFSNEVVVSTVPERLTDYQERAMMSYYQAMSEAYGMELEEIIAMDGFSDVDEFIAGNSENNYSNASYTLIAQAVAESAGLSVSREDLANYFEENLGSPDYSEFEEEYGLPYLKQVVLFQKVMEFIIDNAVLA